MKKSVKNWMTGALALVFLISFCISITARAADAEWRMMHGEQNAIQESNGTANTAEIKEVEVSEKEDSVSIAIIGGADGPTSIFLAGRIGGGFTTAVTIIGISLLLVIVVVAVIVIRKVRKKKHFSE